MLRWLIGIILGEIICKSSNWQYIQRLMITILGTNWQLFRLERIAKCLYFICLCKTSSFTDLQWKKKKNLLPIWWYNRGLFPPGNKYFGVFVLNGLKMILVLFSVMQSEKRPHEAESASSHERVSRNAKVRVWLTVLINRYIQYMYVDSVAITQTWDSLANIRNTYSRTLGWRANVYQFVGVFCN